MPEHDKYREILNDFLFFRTTMHQHETFASEKTKSVAHLLIAIDTFPDSNANFLQEQINVKQSKFSIICKELEESGDIKRVNDPNDSRSKLLSLTKKGKARLNQIDQAYNDHISRFQSNLSASERKRMLFILKEIAEHYNLPDEPPRKSEHVLRPTLRRFTRIDDLFNANFEELKISETVWQILFLLNYEIDELTIKDLAERLNRKHNSTSQQISKLEDQGLVTKAVSTEDARSQFIKLNRKGKMRLHNYESKIVTGLLESLPTKLIKLIDELNTILARFYNVFTDLEDPYLVHKFTQEKYLDRARTFMLENLVKQKMHHCAPELLVSKDQHKVYGLFKDHHLVAVAQFFRDTDLELDCAAWSKDVKPKELKNFVSYLLNNRKRSHKRLITFQPLKAALA